MSHDDLGKSGVIVVHIMYQFNGVLMHLEVLKICLMILSSLITLYEYDLFYQLSSFWGVIS